MLLGAYAAGSFLVIHELNSSILKTPKYNIILELGGALFRLGVSVHQCIMSDARLFKMYSASACMCR